MPPKLTITRGLPGSGKSTEAKACLGAYLVSRDDFRLMLFGGHTGEEAHERAVTDAQRAAVTALLGRGLHVIVHDTNLRQRVARDWRRLAVLAGADFEVWDFTDVPLEECIRRDAERTGNAHVGEAVIRDMHQRYLAGKPYPLPLPEDPADAAGAPVPYVPKPGARPAVMVDIDGTVAKMVNRSPFDESRVHEDRPNLPVIDAVRAMWLAGHEVIFCSGRTAGCRDATEKWLREHVDVPYAALHMRAIGDTRKDSVVKLELFDQHIRDEWRVACVFDDRDQVVAAWRSIGLTVFQVAPGNF